MAFSQQPIQAAASRKPGSGHMRWADYQFEQTSDTGSEPDGETVVWPDTDEENFDQADVRPQFLLAGIQQHFMLGLFQSKWNPAAKAPALVAAPLSFGSFQESCEGKRAWQHHPGVRSIENEQEAPAAWHRRSEGGPRAVLPTGGPRVESCPLGCCASAASRKTSTPAQAIGASKKRGPKCQQWTCSRSWPGRGACFLLVGSEPGDLGCG
ncbi:unnamed protein product [Effrenium voratum]|nr:unnamed protein product [Effrenium voratum]